MQLRLRPEGGWAGVRLQAKAPMLQTLMCGPTTGTDVQYISPQPPCHPHDHPCTCRTPPTHNRKAVSVQSLPLQTWLKKRSTHWSRRALREGAKRSVLGVPKSRQRLPRQLILTSAPRSEVRNIPPSAPELSRSQNLSAWHPRHYGNMETVLGSRPQPGCRKVTCNRYSKGKRCLNGI